MTDIELVLDQLRALPVGEGKKTHGIPGFVVALVSNHNDDDTFWMSITALFAPPDAENGGIVTWESIPAEAVITILAVTAEFSERNFGAPIPDVESELVAEIESFLNNGS